MRKKGDSKEHHTLPRHMIVRPSCGALTQTGGSIFICPVQIIRVLYIYAFDRKVQVKDQAKGIISIAVTESSHVLRISVLGTFPSDPHPTPTLVRCLRHAKNRKALG